MRFAETGHTTPTLFAEAADGTLLAYRVFGGDTGDPWANPVVLVHGFAATGESTWGLTGWIGRVLAAGRVVIVPDLRGHGASGKPHDAAAYSPERLGADLLAVVNAAGADVVDLVGYSLGTRVVSAFARLAPERVGRVVFGGAGPRPMFSVWNPDAARAAFDGAASDGASGTDPLVRQILAPALAAGADPLALRAVASGMAQAPLGVPAGIPLLLVIGSDDPVPVGAAELAAEWGVGLVVVPGRDHVSTVRARRFQQAALEFLGAEGSGEGAAG